jgi:predicted permease
LAVCLLAGGIATATLTFTVVNALLLRPLPVPEPERLVRLVTIRPRLGPRSYFSARFHQLLQSEAAKAFVSVSATYEASTGYTDEKRTERVLVAVTSSAFFTTFGIRPVIGSAFPHDEPAKGTAPVLLSHRFWQRRYGGAHNVIGRPVAIRGMPFEVAGVLPEGFNGATVESGPDVRVPLSALASLFPGEITEKWPAFELVGRLAPEVTIAAAQAEAYRLYVNASEAADPPVPAGEFALEPMTHGASRLRSQAGTATTFALAGAAVLALLVCMNLSGLLLARVIHRRPELAMRSALGASRMRLVVLIAGEAAAIVAAGALLGALPTLAGARWIAAQLPPIRLLDNTAVPMALDLAPDWRVYIFGIGLCLVAFSLMAVVPAWRAAASDPGALRGSSSASRARSWRVLVAMQMALCTALLIGAAAVNATLGNLRNLDAGIVRDRIVCFSLDRDLARPEEAHRFARITSEWRENVRSLPGVRAAAISSIRLMRGSGLKVTVAPAGGSVPSSDFMNTSTQAVGPGYFDTLGQNLIEGRLFTPAEHQGDSSSKIRPALVNQAFVRRFGNSTPMPGRRFGFGAAKVVSPQIEVVGVVTDAKYRSMREPIQPTIYSPISAEASRITLLVRTHVPPASVVEPVRAALHSLDPGLLPEDVSTLEQDIEASLWTERALAWFTNAFAAAAALVAGAGLGGLMLFLVAARRREIAIRVAVGAAPRDVWTLVMGDGLRPLLAGLGAGGAAGFGLVRAAAGILYGVSVRDPYLIAVAAAGVLLLGLAASVIPALKALRLDPARALREN